MRKVLLDTNGLVVLYQFKVDIITEIQRLVPDAKLITFKTVKQELDNLEDKRAAKMAFDIIHKNDIEVISVPGEVDSMLLTYAQNNDAIVFTNDKELKKRCLQMKVPVIFMRKKKMLEIEGL